MDSVLELIADAVTNVIINLSEAENSNNKYRDILPAAQGLQQAGNNMVKIANETAKQAEREFASQILATGNKLLPSVDSLVDAAARARTQTTNARNVRAALADTKSILENVTRLVLIEEQMNLKILSTMAKKAAEASRKINQKEDKTAIRVAVSEAEVYHPLFCARIDKRVNDTRNPAIKARLSDALRNLKNSNSSHWNAAKTNQRGLAQRELTVIIDSLDEIIEALRDAFREAEKFILGKFAFKPMRTIAEDDVVKHFGNLDRHLTDLKNAKPNERVEEGKRVYDDAKAQIEAAHRVLQKTTDPLKKKMIGSAIDNLENELPQLMNSIKRAEANPDDPNAIKDLNSKIESTRAAGKELMNAVISPDAETAIAAAGDQITRMLEELERAVDKNDEKEAGALRDAVDKALKRHIDNSQTYADNIRDPEKRKQVQKGVDSLRQVTPQLPPATNDALNDPNDRAKNRKFHDVVDAAKSALKDISSPPETIKALDNELNYELDNMRRAAEKGAGSGNMNPYEGAEIAKNIAKNIDRQMKVAQELANSKSDPNRRREIQGAIDDLGRVKNRLLDGIDDVMRNPGDKGAQDRLDQLIEEAKGASDRLNQVSQLTPQELADIERKRREEEERRRREEEERRRREEEERRRREEEERRRREEEERRRRAQMRDDERRRQEEEDRRRREEEERRRREEEERRNRMRSKLTPEGNYDPSLMDAAQAMADAAAGGADPNSPLGQLMGASQKIAAEMAKMAAAAAQGDKRGLVDAARKIATISKEAEKSCNAMAKTMRDPRMREELQMFSHSSTSKSVGLKIIAGVKASSDEDDETAEDQLIACAQELSAGIVGAIGVGTASAVKR